MNNLELTIEPKNENYDPSDDRWIDQINDFVVDVQQEVGDVRKEVTPVEGRKGGIEAIILALGSAGAIKAFVDIIKVWITRDRNRSVKLKLNRGGELFEWEIDGSMLNKELVQDFMEVAIKQFSDQDG